MIVLSTNQIIQMHSRLIETSGGSEGIRDYGLLDSAVHAPFQTYDGVSFYPSLISKGARLGYGIIRNHPFLDGNKRIGTHAMLVFLALNGISIDYDDDDLISMIMDVAAGKMEFDSFLVWVESHVK